jgi:hypothetical protein
MGVLDVGHVNEDTNGSALDTYSMEASSTNLRVDSQIWKLHSLVTQTAYCEENAKLIDEALDGHETSESLLQQ